MTNAKADKVCVLGGGHGAHAIAADLTLRGFKVNMCQLPERKGGTFKKTLEMGRIKATGIIEGVAGLNMATTDFGQAIRGARTIFIVVPSFGHQIMAERCAPYLEDGQIVVIAAGNCGSLVLAKVLREKGIKKEVVIAETATLPVVARVLEPAHVGIFCETVHNPVGVFPAKRTKEVINSLQEYYRRFLPVSSVLEACLNNPNGILHPLATLLNVGRIEYADEFRLYVEGMGPSVLKVMGIAMNERAEIGKTLGFEPLVSGDRLITIGRKGFEEYLVWAFGEEAVKAGGSTKGPYSTQDRYVTEDVPYGLVLWESIGNMLNVKVPVISSVIELFSAINGVDYRAEGRTVDKLGIDSMNIAELKKFLYLGIP